MNEKLLREVIARVLSDPTVQGLLKSGNPEILAEKPACLVLVESEESLQSLTDIERCYGSDLDVKLCIVGDEELQVESSVSRISWGKVKEKRTWERMVIPVCSSGQLAQIALGLCLDKVSELTSWAIKQNIPVEIGQVKDEFTAQTPQAYRDLFAGYVKQVTAYGVMIGDDCKVVAAASVLQTVAASVPSVASLPTTNVSSGGESDLVPWSFSVDRKPEESTPACRCQTSFTKRLFTVKEAMALAPYTVLQVAKGTVLTPSALDTLKSNKVEVVRQGVKCL